MNAWPDPTVPGSLDGWWLVACEESGTVRDAFARVGLKAISCDLKPTRSPGPHHQGDVLGVLHAHKWAGVIAHPDCTYLTLAGVRWLMDRAPSKGKVLKGPQRWQALFEACAFLRVFLELDCPVIVENPLPHKYAMQLIGQPYTQIVQPFEYGHLETKRTCLWIKGLEPLVPTDNVEAAMRLLPKSQTHKVHYCSPGEDRAQQRSVFFTGIADAMAQRALSAA